MLVKSLSIESLLSVLPLPPCLPKGDKGWSQWTLFQEFRAKDGFPVLFPMSPSDSGRVPSASSKRDAHFMAATRRSIFTSWCQIKVHKGYKTLLQRHHHWQSDESFKNYNCPVIIKVSLRHTADLINTDSRHSCVTEMLQNTWQGSEKFATPQYPLEDALPGYSMWRWPFQAGPALFLLQGAGGSSCFHCPPASPTEVY